MNIVELRDKRAKLWNSMTAFLDSKTGTDGVLSGEDDATYAKMEQDFTNLTNEIRRQERKDAFEAEMNKAVNDPIIEKPDTAGVEAKTGRASKAYREDFHNHLRGRTPIHNVLSTTPGSDGGYLIPEDLEREIVTDLAEENVVRGLAKVLTVEHDRKIPIAATHTTAAWTAENEAFTESNPTFGIKQIDSYKLTDLVRVSTELLQDSAFDIEEYLSKEFARAFGAAEEEAFCVGTGSTDNQPTGIFTANGGQVGVTTASATAITADELINLIYSLKAPYRRTAKFLLNDATIAMIRKLKDGNGVYIWQPSLQQGQPDKLLGYDVYTSPYVPTAAASALTVAFGDFHNYWIGDRQGRTMQRLNELYATNGQIGYIATERVDGKVILPEGIKLLKQHA